MKKNIDIVRAWKDSAYLNSLSEADRAGLPTNPAGSLSDDDLAVVSGGAEQVRATNKIFTLGCCRVSAGLFCNNR